MIDLSSSPFLIFLLNSLVWAQWTIGWLPVAFGNSDQIPEECQNVPTIRGNAVFRNSPNHTICKPALIQTNKPTCQGTAWPNMGRGYHLWLNFWVWRWFTTGRGVQPPLLDYKSAKAAASLELSTYFPGSTQQPGIMNLKNYLYLQPFSNATGSHPLIIQNTEISL